MNVRQTPLYQLRGEKTRFRTFENDLTEENPREDLVWAGLRRINYALTLRLALNNPLGMLTILIISAATASLYTISIA
jgi:hypothetical protein